MVGGFCVVLLVAFFGFCLYRWSLKRTHTLTVRVRKTLNYIMTIPHIYTERARERETEREKGEGGRGGDIKSERRTDRNTDTQTHRDTDTETDR